MDINPSLVISFNYSNTYERLYGSNAEVCYIHGKAQLTEEDAFNNSKKDADYYSSKNHIVFGMDEYLAEDERKAITFVEQSHEHVQQRMCCSD